MGSKSSVSGYDYDEYLFQYESFVSVSKSQEDIVSQKGYMLQYESFLRKSESVKESASTKKKTTSLSDQAFKKAAQQSRPCGISVRLIRKCI